MKLRKTPSQPRMARVYQPRNRIQCSARGLGNFIPNFGHFSSNPDAGFRVILSPVSGPGFHFDLKIMTRHVVGAFGTSDLLLIFSASRRLFSINALLQSATASFYGDPLLRPRPVSVTTIFHSGMSLQSPTTTPYTYTQTYDKRGTFPSKFPSPKFRN